METNTFEHNNETVITHKIYNILMKYSTDDTYDLIVDENTTILDIVKKAYLNKNKSLLQGVEYKHILDSIANKLKLVHHGKFLKIDTSKVIDILNIHPNDVFHCVFTKPSDEDIININNNVRTSDVLINSLVTSDNFLNFIRVPQNYRKLMDIIKNGFGRNKKTKHMKKSDKETDKKVNVEEHVIQHQPVESLDEIESNYESENSEVESAVQVKKSPKIKKVTTKLNEKNVELEYENAINHLNVMGFSFDDNIKNLLITHKGDIQLVLNTLFA
jgi:hypothetical protein